VRNSTTEHISNLLRGGNLITGTWNLNHLLRVKILHLIDRSDLFKISNLVYDGREIVRSICSSGDRGATEVKVLCYKSEGRWSDPAGVIENFH